LILVGAFWVVLTVAFEFSVDILPLGVHGRIWRLITIWHTAGLLGFGMVVLLFSPVIARRLRGTGGAAGG
jgi:hypothetical protein